MNLLKILIFLIRGAMKTIFNISSNLLSDKQINLTLRKFNFFAPKYVDLPLSNEWVI